jgi:hypothetical protein
MIVIPTQHTATGVRMRTGQKVAWRVARTESQGSLIKTVGALSDQIPSGGQQTLMGEADVIRLRFEYMAADAPGKWVSEWNRDEDPVAVRMSIVVADPDRSWIQVSRKAVFPVNVR